MKPSSQSEQSRKSGPESAEPSRELGQANPGPVAEATGSGETPQRRVSGDTKSTGPASEGRSRFNPGPNSKANGLAGNPAYQRYLADHRVKLRQLEEIAGGWNTYRPTKY